MSDDDLTIGQKVRSGYFCFLLAALIGLLGLAVYYFMTVTHAFQYETAAVLIWIFFFWMTVWLIFNYLEIGNLRRWIGWLETAWWR